MRTKQEVEENDRTEKTRDLFNKIGDVKGTFHAKMGIINGRNHKDLTEKKIVRRRGKNKENSTKKVLMIQITTMIWSFT